MNHLSLLRRLAEQHQFAALTAACEEADASEPAVRVLMALGLAQQGQRDAAWHWLSMLEAPDLDVDARVDLATVYLTLGDLPRGLALLEATAGEAGEHGPLLARLGWHCLHQGRLHEATALYERSVRATPRIGPLLALARLYLQGAPQPDLLAARDLLCRAEFSWQTQRDDWPEPQRQIKDHQLRALQLALCMAEGRFTEAEVWLDRQRTQLSEDDWVALVLAHGATLAASDQHTQAEESLRAALRHHARNVPLLMQCAELAQVQGRAQNAMVLWRRAIRCAEAQGKDTVALWMSLAACAVMVAPATARRAAERALLLAEALQADDHPPGWTAQCQAQAECTMAQVEAHEQRLTEADTRYRAVLAARPDFPSALQGLGQLEMQRGHIDEAVRLFDRLAAIDPAKGHSALITARRFPEDDATLAKLEQLARRPGLEGRVRSGLLLQLAAVWDHRRDAERAFALAREGNDAARRLLPYDPAARRQQCARIRHAFSRSLYEHRPVHGIDSDVPVFVVGMPRSGTSLVEQILAGHSQVFGAGELGLVPGRVAGLDRWERHTGSGRTYPDCIDDLSPEASARIAAAMLTELQALAPEARYIVDKLPHNFEHIGLIKFLFPRAKVISVRRDPRDIAISSYFTDFQAKHGGLGYTYDLRWIGQQLADHNLLMHHWHQVFPGEILEVQYEDVLADTEAAARRLLAYLDLPWEPQVLQFNELDRPVRTASVWQVRQPIYQTAKARWVRYAEHLGPLIAGTNAPIEWAPITDMVALPEPGLLDVATALYQAQDLDGAERCCQVLLHHVPGHAAAQFVVGLIAVNKGHLRDGIALMEAAHAKCPWNENWRRDLARAHALVGDDNQAAAIHVPETALTEDLRW